MSGPDDRPRHPVAELTLARFREFWREPGAVFWAFGFPLLLSLALGIAFRERERPLPRVGHAEDTAVWLHEALDRAAADGRLVAVAMGAEEARRALRIGAVDLLVGADGGDDGPVGRRLAYEYDPSRDQSAVARVQVDDALQRALGRADALPTADETEVLPGGRYVDFLFPGILGMSLMSSCVWGIGYSIVLARKRKQLKRLAATPMRRGDFMLATFLSRAIFLAVLAAVLLLFGRLVFGITVSGGLAALVLVATLGSTAFAGLALVVAARVESVEAANGWLNFATLPMWMLSGVFFSYERFPEFSHLPIRLLPLTALNDGLRRIVNEGAGLGEVPFELAVLAAWTVGTFAVAARRFRWQ